MRRLFTWTAGAVGGLAAYRAVARRKPAPADELEPAAAAVDPADELRAKLAEARAEVPEPAGPADRRQAVRDQAKAALDEMQGDS